MTKVCNSVSRGALAAAMILWVSPSWAQTTPGALSDPAQEQPGGAASDTGPVGGDSDVVVTANKRAENVQDVPLAVSVVTPAQLATAGVREFQDLGRIAPSLVIRPAEHPVNANVSLRGVGTFAFSIGVEPSVAVLIDEVPLAFQARAFTDLPDVERIEVLRGPQSTLYGKAASAGLINIITRNPTDEFQGRVNAIVTTDEEYGGNFSFSGPVTPTLGAIVSGSYSFFDGNVTNRFDGKEVNGRDVVTTRAKLRWEPTPDTAITLSGNYLYGKTDVGRPFIRLSPTALLRNTPGLTSGVFAPGVSFDPENTEVSNNYASRTDYRGYGANLRAEIGLPLDHQLVSITSYDRFRLNDYLDQDDTSAPGPFGNNIQVGTFESKQWTQEFRLLSPSDKPFRYTLGVFYADVSFERPFYRGPAFSQANWFATAASKQYAAFAQVDWEILPRLTLTGGFRAQKEEIAYSFNDILVATTNPAAQSFFDGSAKDNFQTYKGSARYEFTDDIMVFGTYSTGHKGQTFDLTTGFNRNRQLAGPIQPETSENFEIGTRTQFFDRRLTINLTAFNTNYDDFQAQGVEFLPDGTQNFRLTNVGKLRTRGIELDASARVMDDLTLAGAVAYLDAKVRSFPFAACYPLQTAAQGCTGTPARQSLAGFRPAQAPEWKLSTNVDYSPSLTSDLRGLAQANFQYQTKVNYSLSQDPQTVQKAYGVVNIGLGVRAEDRGYEIVAFVNNLFNEKYFPTLVNSLGNFGNQLATQAIIPRDFERYGGVRMSFNF
jgi:iron complex outermembrane recepter protein